MRDTPKPEQKPSEEDVLRRMLNTPPKPHEKKTAPVKAPAKNTKTP